MIEVGQRVVTTVPLMDTDHEPVSPGAAGMVLGFRGQYIIVELDTGENYLGQRRHVEAPPEAFRRRDQHGR